MLDISRYNQNYPSGTAYSTQLTDIGKGGWRWSIGGDRVGGVRQRGAHCILSSNSERSDLRFEAWKPVFVKRDMRVWVISRERPVLKLDFSAHGIMESLSEFGLCTVHAHRVPTPAPPPLHVGTAGKNHLNVEITPLFPTGIGERYSQTISNLGHSALLRLCELPL